MKIAVIGAGLAGKQHIDTILNNKNCELDLIVDPSQETYELSKKLNVQYFSSIELALGKCRPDGAIIATPNSKHKENAKLFLDKKIPILIEKPLSSDIKSAVDIVMYAKKQKTKILTGHHRRHNKIIQKAKSKIQSGNLGKIIAIHASCWLFKPNNYFNSWRKSLSGGPLLINLVHDIDLMLYLIGEIECVLSFESNSIRGGETEDTAVVILKFKNGTLGTLSVSDTIISPWSWELTSKENPVYPYQKQNCYWIGGTHGSLELPQSKIWKSTENRSWWEPMTYSKNKVDETRNHPLNEQLDNFLAVIEKKEEPVCSGLDGLNTLAVIEAIKLAAERGAAVKPERITE